MLLDDHGQPLKPTHAKKGNKRYRYYYGPSSEDEARPVLRVRARELEKAVLQELTNFLRDERRLLAAVPRLGASDTKALLAAAPKMAQTLETGRATDRIKVFNELIARVVVATGSLAISVRKAGLSTAPIKGEANLHTIAVPVHLKRGNHAMRLVVRDQAIEARVPDAGLVALLARANR